MTELHPDLGLVENISCSRVLVWVGMQDLRLWEREKEVKWERKRPWSQGWWPKVFDMNQWLRQRYIQQCIWVGEFKCHHFFFIFPNRLEVTITRFVFWQTYKGTKTDKIADSEDIWKFEMRWRNTCWFIKFYRRLLTSIIRKAKQHSSLYRTRGHCYAI